MSFRGRSVLNERQGEYTTGWTGAGASTSDKKVRTLALSLRKYGRLMLVIDRRTCYLQ
jgi:hypothetical protein